MKEIHSTSGSFFFIATYPSPTHSRKPRHLEKRLHNRSPRSVGTVIRNRELLISQRKAKLAEQLSHVAEVYNRHQALSRDGNKLKGKMLAKNLENAESRRQALVEQQVNHCKRIVEKAKRIAASQARKELQMRNKIVKHIDDKLRCSSIRRKKLLGTPKSKIISSLDEISVAVSEDMAARLIQNWYRMLSVKKLVQDFRELNLNLNSIKRNEFDVNAHYLQKQEIITATTNLLKAIEKMGVEYGQKGKMMTRVFLSAFMAVVHPTEILSCMGDQEQELQSFAETMIQAFENFLDSITTFSIDTLSFSILLNQFQSAWSTYYKTFTSWRKGDNEKLLHSLIEHHVELDKLWENVRENVDGDSEWRPGIMDRQKLLKERIIKLAGRNGLKKLEEARKKAAVDFACDASSLNSPSRSRRSSLNAMELEQKDSVLKSRSISSEGLRIEQGGGELPRYMSQPGQDDVMARFGLSDGVLTNEVLAHELILDPEFSLTLGKSDDLAEKVKEMTKKAFWDNIREKVEDGDYLSWLPSLIDDVKKNLLSLVKENGKMYVNIAEALDVELITQQIANNIFDLKNLLQYVTSVMIQLCAPIRDEAIQSLSRKDDIVDFLAEILNIIDLMKLDLANYHLQALKPHLQSQIVEYETKKFQEDLKNGKTTLGKAEAWITDAVSKLREVFAARNPENVEIVENKVKFTDVYFEALLSLISSTSPISPVTVPETLALDAKRLFTIQNDVQLYTVVAALIMLCCNLCDLLRRNRSATAEFKNKLILLLSDSSTNLNDIALEMIHFLNTAHSAASRPVLTSDQESLVKTMVSKTLSYKDTIYSLLHRRIIFAIRNELITGRFRRDSLVSLGLDAVKEEIEGLSRQVAILAKHNSAVYANWYDDLIKKAIEKDKILG